MKKPLLTLLLSAFAWWPLCAAEPQLVIENTSGDVAVWKMTDVAKVQFTESTLNLIATTGDAPQSMPYSTLAKVRFDHDGSVSAVADISAQSAAMRVAPSPATSYITATGVPDGCALAIYATDGKAVVIISHYDGRQINIAALPSGIYIVNAAGSSAKFFKK